MKFCNYLLFVSIIFLVYACSPVKFTEQEYEKYRISLINMEKKSLFYRLFLRDSVGYTSPKAQKIILEMVKQDSLNLQEFLFLIKKYDFPTKSTVGENATIAGFNILQHADANIRIKYLKKIVKMAKRKEISWYNVALMQDRILLEKDKKQLYGTQRQLKIINGAERQVVNPIKKFKNIDKRRLNVGLDSFHLYLKEGA